MVTSDKVKTMIKNIEKERDLPKEDRINFDIGGIHTLFPGEDGPGHNCITWDITHLDSIGIYLGKSIIGSIITIPWMYTSLPKNHKSPQIKRIYD